MHVLPRNRDSAMVFLNYALYPHPTVADNVSVALNVLRMSRDETRKRVEDAAKI